jgi:hypothetical protein
MLPVEDSQNLIIVFPDLNKDQLIIELVHASVRLLSYNNAPKVTRFSPKIPGTKFQIPKNVKRSDLAKGADQLSFMLGAWSQQLSGLVLGIFGFQLG